MNETDDHFSSRDQSSSALEPLAVIGVACRLPGAHDAEQYWQNLVSGVESVHATSLEEQIALGMPEDEVNDPDFRPVRSILDDPEYFEAAFFGMSAREAQLRDPQHRLFLELAYNAFEDSGYDPSRFQGDIGVYAGAGESGYEWLNIRRSKLGSLPRRRDHRREQPCRLHGSPGVLQAEPARPELHRAHRVLHLDGGDPPRLRGRAQRRVRHGGCRRGEHRPAVRPRIHLRRRRHLQPRRALPDLRRERHRHHLGQRRRRRGAATAVRRAGQRRPHPCRGAGQRDQQRRRDQGGLHRTQRAGPGRRDPACARRRRDRPSHRQLRRGARHRHRRSATRSRWRR